MTSERIRHRRDDAPCVGSCYDGEVSQSGYMPPIPVTVGVIALISCFVYLAVLFLDFAPIFQGGPYAPSNQQRVCRMVELAGLSSGGRMADLGSGDGRIVLAFASSGVEAHGFEINPRLVWLSRRAARRRGLGDRAVIHRRNFWKEDLSGFDVVTVFGIGHVMRRLGTKLRRELKPGALVIANGFPIPGWRPQYEKDHLYVYRMDGGWGS